MNLRRRINSFLLFGASVLIAGALWLWRHEDLRNRADAASLSREKEKVAALQSGWKSAHDREERARNACAVIVRELAKPRFADTAGAGQRKALRKRAQISMAYSAFFHGLDLPPKTRRKVEAILGKKAESEQDIKIAASQQALLLSDPAIAGLLQKEEDQARVEITALIGPDDDAKMQEYDRAAPIRMAGATMASLTYDIPLTPEQNRQLIELLAQTSPHFNAGGPADDLGLADAGPLLAQAQTFLSFDQLNALRIAYSHWQATSGMHRRIAELQAQGTLPPGVTADEPER